MANNLDSLNNYSNCALTSYTYPEHPLRIDTQTWHRDSHDLFDYEAVQVQQHRFYTSRQARVFRQSSGEVYVTGDCLPIQLSGADCLLNIRVKDGRYLVAPADRLLSQHNGGKKLWMIVRELPDRAHGLQEGDVIKLGRFKLRVRQLAKKEGSTPPEIRLDDSESPISEVTEEEAQTMQCRICLLDGGTGDDPLICPCQCKGSIKFVHVGCLRHWLSGRLGFSADQGRYFFKQQTCELCKHIFPTTIRLPKGEKLNIVSVPRTEAPFIVLENVVSTTGTRGMHVFSMAEKKDLKLGRGHESDVRIADVSISRYHATIRYNEGKFLLDDHESKFGTLVCLKRPQPLDCSEKFSVQVGRTVLNFEVDASRLSCADIIEEVVSVNDDVSSKPTQDMATVFTSSAVDARSDNMAAVGGSASLPNDIPKTSAVSNESGVTSPPFLSAMAAFRSHTPSMLYAASWPRASASIIAPIPTTCTAPTVNAISCCDSGGNSSNKNDSDSLENQLCVNSNTCLSSLGSLLTAPRSFANYSNAVASVANHSPSNSPTTGAANTAAVELSSADLLQTALESLAVVTAYNDCRATVDCSTNNDLLSSKATIRDAVCDSNTGNSE